MSRDGRKQWMASVALWGGLALPFCLVLSQLWIQTSGVNAILALSAAAIFLAFRVRSSSLTHRLRNACLLVLIMLVVSLTAGDPTHLGSGIAWAGIMGIGLCAGECLLHAQGKTQSGNTAGCNSPISETIETDAPVAEPVFAPVDSPAEQTLPWNALAEFDEGEFFDEECEEELEEGETDERVVHAWTRRRDPEEERLEGSVIVEFQPGQKQVYVHVPFLPGFSSRPQALCYCEEESLFGVEFDILQTYGGRLNVRRRGDVREPAEVEVTFAVTAPWTSQRAA